MKKKNFFAQNKQFTFFLILAVLIYSGCDFCTDCKWWCRSIKGRFK